MLSELWDFYRLFLYENISSDLPSVLIILYLNAGLYLFDFYNLVRRKSLLETFCIMCLPCLTAVLGAMAAVTVLHVPKPGSPRMLTFLRALSDTRLCMELFLPVIVYLLLWGFIYLSRRRQSRTQRQNWIVACIPDYLACICILGVNSLVLLAGADHISRQMIYVYLYCITFLSCKIILLAVGILVSLYSVRIKIFKWKEPKDPSSFLLRYFLLYQNAIFRNVFLYGTGTMLIPLIPLARSGELHGKMIGAMAFVFLCCIFIMASAIRPVIKNISKFRFFSKDVKAIKEVFCREYFQEEPIYRDHRYTITRSFLIDEQSPATFYYWAALTHMTGWCITPKGKTKVLTFSDLTTCTLTEDDLPTAEKVSDYAKKVLDRKVFPFEASPAVKDKLEQGFDTLFRWLIMIVVFAFIFAKYLF